MSERTRADLQYRQRLPLDIKVAMTRSRIREWKGYRVEIKNGIAMLLDATANEGYVLNEE